uniref:Uncharacterized protein n=1 Tax=Hemiselmis andersenii TaxID=464988 RepID=A0A6U4UP22_HEMAN|mmetsp:Transcript_12411/g.29061  ORF Transcript_12411/g.29061 Transcript_12411/m.29061 type:complete len:144 (-) Transcript_12411:228-659(-)|eukprot:CAMPEP_0114129872 /NCGR_PEP_ID=MMETSP0043_2-20121206/11707_1 /TAXON_ID=464988 /ORGANISM="Hemiselmis andersenii, Strain CCMP644" /LENGTH=143 /DNA_ID=CAMNT_0001223177 /DNA_START=177 /DNA_END=608 /DNA_ORIENTATION=-
MSLVSRATLFLVSVAVLLLLASPAADARPRGNKGSSRPAADQDMRLKRIDCERTQCRGMQGEARSTCTYQCMSPACFSEVYAHDELEEGEVDTERARQYAFCFKKAFRKQQDEKNEKLRKEAAERRAALAAQRATGGATVKTA